MRALLGLAASLVLAAAPPDLGPGHTFTPRARWTDELDQTHVRYQHFYNGRRVWGSEWVDHQGPGAAPPTLNLAVGPTPPLAPLLAVLPAAGEPILWPEVVPVPATDGADAELMDQDVVAHRDALTFKAQPDPADTGEDAWDVITDAATGEVLEQIPVNLLDTAVKGTGLSQYRGRLTLDTTSTGARTASRPGPGTMTEPPW